MSQLKAMQILREISPDVSHETEEKLLTYVDFLLKWNKKINLISQNTISDLWMRHVVDSAQIIKFINDKSETVLDVGAGAGFPGIILSLLGVKNILLLDSDKRKCSFLLEVGRLLELNLEVINSRIEAMVLPKANILTCRGFASISNIFRYCAKMKYDRILLFKGRNCKNEIKEAVQNWNFEYITYPSITDSKSYILDIMNVYKK